MLVLAAVGLRPMGGAENKVVIAIEAEIVVGVGKSPFQRVYIDRLILNGHNLPLCIK